jgi:glycosyltransferase involved in cell wall biosynthesis
MFSLQDEARQDDNLGVDAPSWLFVLSWELRHAGGVNEVVKNLFDRTARRLRHRPLLLVRKWEQKIPVLTLEDGRATIAARIRGPWPDPRWPLANLAVYILGLPFVVGRLLRMAHVQRIAVINVHYPDLHALTWILVRQFSCKPIRLVLSFHGLDLKSAIAATGLERVGWSILLRRSDQIVVCAQALRERLISRFPGCAQRVNVVGNGVDIQSVQTAMRESPAMALPKSYVMSIGTYERKKGHDVLMAAFDHVASRNPSVALVIAGRYSEAEYTRLTRLKEQLASRDRILLLKDLAHAEAMRVLAGAEVFALASREEPFGIAILEAAVLSRPVVATSVCGAANLFRAGTDLLVVPPNDVAALSAAMERLLNDRAGAAGLAGSLHSRVVANFDWDSVADGYLRLLRLPLPAEAASPPPH